MCKLTDLEICKRIAKIEGINSEIDSFFIKNDGTANFNPLEDSALCFSLMVKYRVSLLDEYFTGLCDKWVAEISKTTQKVYVVDEMPDRAICLAIIEAHRND